MTPATVWLLLIVFLPFLLSLGAEVAMPKVLCFVTSLLTLLLTVEPERAFLPWAVGMVIAVVAVRERIRSSWGI